MHKFVALRYIVQVTVLYLPVWNRVVTYINHVHIIVVWGRHLYKSRACGCGMGSSSYKSFPIDISEVGVTSHVSKVMLVYTLAYM